MAAPKEDPILTACRTNDVPALKTLFSEHNITPTSTSTAPIDEYLLAAGLKNPNPAIFDFLASYFTTPTTLTTWLLSEALQADNVALVRAICKLDPGLVTREEGPSTALCAAFSQTTKPENIKILLDAGAQPDARWGHQNFSSAEALVDNGFPAATMELMFDAGYAMSDRPPVDMAMERKRADLVEVLYRRGRGLPQEAAGMLPSAERAMELAKASGDEDMVSMVKGLFPGKFDKKPGLLARLFRS